MITLPSRHLVITVVIVVASFFLLLWANERYSAYVSARDTVAEKDWLAAKKNWEKVHARILTTLAAAAKADTVIASERAKAGRALAVADSLRRERNWTPPPVFTDSTNPRWRGLYYSALGEIVQLRLTVHSDTLALNAAMFSRDSLRAVLLVADTAGTKVATTGQKLIDARTCKVLWLISCPSRRVVAVTSGVLGLAAGAYIERQRSKR